MIKEPLKIPNPSSFDLGEMFGIAPDRLDELGKLLDAVVVKKGEPKLIYASEMLRRIESICDTKEEFVWCLFNHLIWLGKHGRLLDQANLQQAINKYGQPQNLK